MKLADFQLLCGRSDPRTVLIFQRPFVEVFPHIAVTGKDLCCRVVRYNADACARDGGASERSPSATTNGYDMSFEATLRESVVCSSGGESPKKIGGNNASAIFNKADDTSSSPFLQQFAAALEQGAWLVVESISDVRFDEWRKVGAILAQLLPNAKFHLRRQFRLFTFIEDQSSSPNLWTFAPGLFCQFALVVDPHGKVHSRADVSPIFHGDCSVDATNIGDLLATMVNAGNPNNGVDGSISGGARDVANISSIRQKLVAALEARAPATDPDYVDEVLCSLREYLVERQLQLQDGVEDEVEKQLTVVMQENELAVRKAEENSFAPSNPTELSILRKNPDKERARLRLEEVKRIESDRDWVYRATLEWSIHQCPDAEAVGLCQIPPEELLADTVAWTNSVEVCYFASWDGGCEVLIKEPHVTYNTAKYSRALAAFAKEASRHSSLRHPQVLQLYGVSQNKMVLEYGIGTLDQALIRARGETRRWTPGMFLRLAQQIARGMLYCSQKVVHRALACRSIVETTPGQFKVAQFGSAIPLITIEAKEGLVPIRSCSPEALLGVFSEKSDVWSFGVLMWEAVQYCALLPYNDNVQPATAIAQGTTLPQPQNIPEVLFETVIAPCLVQDPEARPSFRDLLEAIEGALRNCDQSTLSGLVPLPAERMTFTELNEARSTAKPTAA